MGHWQQGNLRIEAAFLGIVSINLLNSLEVKYFLFLYMWFCLFLLVSSLQNPTWHNISYSIIGRRENKKFTKDTQNPAL